MSGSVSIFIASTKIPRLVFESAYFPRSAYFRGNTVNRHPPFQFLSKSFFLTKILIRIFTFFFHFNKFFILTISCNKVYVVYMYIFTFQLFFN